MLQQVFRIRFDNDAPAAVTIVQQGDLIGFICNPTIYSIAEHSPDDAKARETVWNHLMAQLDVPRQPPGGRARPTVADEATIISLTDAILQRRNRDAVRVLKEECHEQAAETAERTLAGVPQRH